MNFGPSNKIVPSPDGLRIAVLRRFTLEVRDVSTGAVRWSTGVRRNTSSATWCGACVVVQDTSGIAFVHREDGPSIPLSDSRVRAAEWTAPADSGDGHVFTVGSGGVLARWRLADGALVATATAEGRMKKILGVREGSVWAWVMPEYGSGDSTDPALHRWPLSLAPGGHDRVPVKVGYMSDVVGWCAEGLWVRTSRAEVDTLALVDLSTGAVTRTVTCPGTGISGGPLSPTGDRLAWGGEGRVRVASLTGPEVRLSFPWRQISKITWHPDGESVWVAAGEDSGRVDLAAPAPPPPRVDPDSLRDFAALFAAWDAGDVDDEVVHDRTHALLYDVACDAARSAALPEVVRAVVVSGHLEHHMDWDGLDGASYNLPEHVALGADAWRVLGLEGCATVWSEVSKAVNSAKGRGARWWEAREAKLNELGADAPQRRLALIRAHRDLFLAVAR
jgi:hypothetical protein